MPCVSLNHAHSSDFVFFAEGGKFRALINSRCCRHLAVGGELGYTLQILSSSFGLFFKVQWLPH